MEPPPVCKAASHLILIDFYGKRMVNPAIRSRRSRSLIVETFPITLRDKAAIGDSFMRATLHVSRALAAVFMAASSIAFAADGGDWTVSKASGEVWLAGSDVQQASLKQQDVLKPGDTVRTGRTGRVLLKRGDETILISPNSVVGVPVQQ